MADRGFEIQDLLVLKKASLNIPPFMRCKDQLDPEEEDETRQIASVHIHVERAIERIKNFNILRQIIPNTMAEDNNMQYANLSCFHSNNRLPNHTIAFLKYPYLLVSGHSNDDEFKLESITGYLKK